MLPGLVNGGLTVLRLGTDVQTFLGRKKPTESLAGFRAIIGNQDSLVHGARSPKSTRQILQKQNCSVEYLLCVDLDTQANIWRGFPFVRRQARGFEITPLDADIIYMEMK
jgi:hypothetical protein